MCHCIFVRKNTHVYSKYHALLYHATDRREDRKDEESRVLLEVHTNLPENYGCVLASTLVDAADNVTLPVRIFNPTCEPVQIKQDSVIGQAESVNIVNTISKTEDPSQVGNMSIVKRIAF